MAASAVTIIERHAAPPRLPVARPRLPTAADLGPYLERIDAARWYSNFGALVTELEQRLAARFERPTAVTTVTNGTVAITLALQALDCEPGALCALPAWTFVATAHAVRAAGLEPWFLDVDPVTWMLDPAATLEALSVAPGPVAAIVPVSAFGALPNLDAWASVAKASSVPVVADCAAAFDTITRAPIPVTVSLHATKSVSTGEGGYVASEDAAFIARVREMSAFGFRGDRLAHVAGGNHKLSEYAGAVGLASLDAWPETRRRLAYAAQTMKVALALTPQVAFQPGWGSHWVSSVCAVGLPDGAAEPVAARLAAAGIDTRAWWGGGCHTQPAFENCLRDALPVTEQLAASTLGLPYFVDLDEAAAWRIVDALIGALKEI